MLSAMEPVFSVDIQSAEYGWRVGWNSAALVIANSSAGPDKLCFQVKDKQCIRAHRAPPRGWRLQTTVRAAQRSLNE